MDFNNFFNQKKTKNKSMKKLNTLYPNNKYNKNIYPHFYRVFAHQPISETAIKKLKAIPTPGTLEVDVYLTAQSIVTCRPTY